MLLKPCHQKFGQFLDAGLVVGIADVDYSIIADTVSVLNDPVKTLNPVRDICKTTPLVSRVDELDRSALHKVQDQLGDCA